MKIEFGNISDEPFEVSTKYRSNHNIPIDDVEYTFSFVVVRVDTTSNTTSKPVYEFTEFNYFPVIKETQVVAENEQEGIRKVAITELDPQRVEGIKDLLKISILEHLAKHPLTRGFKDR